MTAMADQAAAERAGSADADARFEFGENWRRFLSVLDDRRIGEAERSLIVTLGEEWILGRTMLDAGSGSGLFSLAALRLGADRVHSFDFDQGSVGCTIEVRDRFLPGDPRWQIERGDMLDRDYLEGLGKFDVVYSWGVLHHTGNMWAALENIDRLVAPGGRLVISIYNDQGIKSRIWRRVKRVYNWLPQALRRPYVIAVMAPRELRFALTELLAGRPLGYLRTWTEYHASRGMSRWHDLVDWVGGYPFEVAKPEQIFAHFRDRGYTLLRLKTCGGGLGCNEYVFEKRGAEGA
jgi:2-polyprenyl-3-methyl-5-hydroxy-6-metoxy-1,4-benzoquinol methylase